MRLQAILAVMLVAFAGAAALMLTGHMVFGVVVALLGAAGMVAVARALGQKEPPTIAPYQEHERSLW